MDIADIFYANFDTMENKTERPILYSTPMVQSIFENRKTMTRRTKGLEELSTAEYEYKGMDTSFKSKHVFARIFRGTWVETNRIKCPYGEPGDLLWVRETWMDAPNYPLSAERYYYKASVSDQFISEWPKSWKPSIHMPKAACRLWLEITDIRVERLHDISEEDAKAEGIEFLDRDEPYTLGYKLYGNHSYTDILGRKAVTGTAIESFESLWQKINGVESWNANPWVWVITFKKL